MGTTHSVAITNPRAPALYTTISRRRNAFIASVKGRPASFRGLRGESKKEKQCCRKQSDLRIGDSNIMRSLSIDEIEHVSGAVGPIMFLGAFCTFITVVGFGHLGAALLIEAFNSE
jgi:hypothetical protein